jgi:hypothetical protein
MPDYDLLVYHDMSDTMHDSPPEVGQDAAEWFGDSYRDLFVAAVGPGIHPGRTTIVLSNESRPEMQQEVKRFFAK